jgi:hypothetical protein
MVNATSADGFVTNVQLSPATILEEEAVDDEADLNGDTEKRGRRLERHDVNVSVEAVCFSAIKRN